MFPSTIHFYIFSDRLYQSPVILTSCLNQKSSAQHMPTKKRDKDRVDSLCYSTDAQADSSPSKA